MRLEVNSQNHILCSDHLYICHLDSTRLTVFSLFSAMSSSSDRGSCSICRRDMPIRSDGKVKIHGPVLNRCLGSGVSLVDPSSITVTHMAESSTPSTSPSVSADTPGVVNGTSLLPRLINPGRFTDKVVKRIPCASRHQAALKLTDILDDLNA